MIALIALATFFVLYDVRTTIRRLKKYGPAVELNPLTKWLGSILGPIQGAFAGIVVPHALITIISFQYEWSLVYTFYTGYLTNHFLMQLASIRLEHALDEQLGRR